MEKQFKTLPKLKKGDRVAIVSPSFAAPGKWPWVYELGLKRLRDVFGLEPVEFSVTKKLGASAEERSKDLIEAFERDDIKAVIAAIGGDDQVTYIKNLPKEVFTKNPKPFFGYSDNTHFINYLWLLGIPSFYGGHLFTEFAMQNAMDDFSINSLNHALFGTGEVELESSKEFNDIGLNWNDPATLDQKRRYQPNEGFIWHNESSAEGITWGGCLESIDEMLRHNIEIPSLEEFKDIILFTETSEEMPEADYVYRVFRALGERGILKNIKGLLVGRPKAWEFNKQKSDVEKETFKKEQREVIAEAMKKYNNEIPLIQNIDIGHTAPQISMPTGKKLTINGKQKKIKVAY